MKRISPAIKFISKHQKKFRDKLVVKIQAYNKSKVGPLGWKSISLEAKNEKGKFIGGLTGSTFLGWLYVDILFVDQNYRGQGVGKQLLHQAEVWAKKRGCKYVNLNTITFQAPGFYRKLGYRLYGKLEPYPKGHIRYYLKKKL
jgi:GNAT superfamily N-acetyltransferase